MRVRGAALVVALAGSLLGAVPAGALPPADRGRTAGLFGVLQPQTMDGSRTIDANRIDMVVTNFGSFAFTGSSAGLEFPRGSGRTAVFAGGIWLGGRINGVTKVAVTGYSNEWFPGPILPGGVPADPADPIHRVYKISRVYASVAERDSALAAYNAGALPYGADPVTVQPNGTLNILGDQLTWCVYNEADSVRHATSEENAGHTGPLGIEVQQTTYAFDRPGPLGQTVFLRFRMINKGGNQIDSMYASAWLDPDLGHFSDDLVGCDTTLALGHTYNVNSVDLIYGRAPPAVGWLLLRGPTGYGGTALGMTAFDKFANEAGGDPDHFSQVYNFMQGLNRDGTPVVDPTTGLPTRFFHSGNPLTGSGWLDGSPADVRMLVTSGPFSMAPGDTQVVEAAIVIGHGPGRLASLAALDCAARYVRDAFELGLSATPESYVSPSCPGALAPAVISVAPASAPTGGAVTIEGANFGATPTENVVHFGGVRATITAASTTELSVVVPAGAGHAPVSVTTGGRSAYSRDPFVLTFPNAGILDARSFAARLEREVPSLPTHLTSADFSLDGRLEIAAVTAGDTSGAAIVWNTGSGGGLGFTFLGTYAVPGPSSAASGDLDGDGRLDLALDNFANNNDRVSLLRNASIGGPPSFATQEDFLTGNAPHGIGIRDLDGDGKPDLAVVAQNSEAVSLLKNMSVVDTLRFSPFTTIPTGGNRPAAIAMGDLDADGRPDLAVSDENTGVVRLFRNTGAPGTLTFAVAADVSVGGACSDVAVADVDGDSLPDLLVASRGPDIVAVLRNTGSFAFAAPLNLATGAGPVRIAIASLDGDGRPDVVAATQSLDSVVVIRNTSTTGSVSFAPRFALATGHLPAAVVLADFSGDGKPEIATADYGSSRVSVFRNQVAEHIITASAGPNGTITPSGTIGVPAGADLMFTIAPDAGHRVADVRVDEVSVGAVTAFSFTDIQADHTISASFEVNPFAEFAVRTDFYVTDGTVRATALSPARDLLYIGGEFSHVGPATGGGVPLDGVSGSPPASFGKVAGIVRAVAPDGNGGWYIGGSFTAVAGVPRSNLAHVRSDGTVSSWNPGPNDVVAALAVSGSTVYAGGAFTTIGGQARARLAAIDPAGVVTSWNPAANSIVYALVANGTTVYAGGAFTTIGGQPRTCLAALDAGTGAASAWNPAASGPVLALAVSGSTIYAGGTFSFIGGQPRTFLSALDAGSGAATAWNPGANNGVHALVLIGANLIVGGDFTHVGGQPRNRIAGLDAASGLATGWDPNANDAVHALAALGSTVYAAGAFTGIGGQQRNRLAALDGVTGFASSWNPNANAPVYALAVAGSTIFAGGDFTGIGGLRRNRIAALDVATGVVSGWNPGANGGVYALSVSGPIVYAGGLFTSISGQPRNYLAALDATTGSATAWNPGANGVVLALARVGSTVIPGGEFTIIGGQFRNRIAALDGATGLATPWNPNANAPVYALAASGSTVYAGGAFSSIGGQSRNRIAALDGVTGLASAWNPNANAPVHALERSGQTVYAGGDFTTIGGQGRNFIAALDPVTGTARSWNPNANSWVRALAVGPSAIHAGGDFTSVGAQGRDRIAALDSTTGLATTWNPGANTVVRALAVSGPSVFAGGDFTTIGRLPQSHVAAVVPVAEVFTIIATADANGAIQPTGAVEVSPGQNQTFTIAPNPGYLVLDVAVDSVSVGAVTQYTFTNVQANHTITASFRLDALTITATAGPNGSISPSGAVQVPRGQDRLFTISPNPGHHVQDVVVDGGSVGAVSQYAFADVQTDHTIAASFVASEAVVRSDFYVTNGPVHATALSPAGDVLYIGGDFTQVGPASGGGVELSVTSGAPSADFPKVSGTVSAVASDGAGGWYIGGDFTAVGDVPRSNLAHVRADGTVGSWDPGADASVFTLAVSGATIYTGGAFTSIGGQPRGRVAALDAATGIATAWSPSVVGSPVRALAVSGSTVYLGGDFFSVGGLTRVCLAAVDATTGTATDWNPNPSFPGGGSPRRVSAIAVNGTTVYVGGTFTGIGGQARNQLASLDAVTGSATTWDPNPNGSIVGQYALAAGGSTIYVGGTFTTIGGQARNRIAALNPITGAASDWDPSSDGSVRAVAVNGSTVYAGGSFTSIGGQARSRIAALDATTGIATAWSPEPNGVVLALAASGSAVYMGGGFTSFGGQARRNLAGLNIASGATIAWNPGADSTVYALTVADSTVYAGGDFTTIGGQARNRIAALDGTTGVATAWDPDANATVVALAVGGSTVYAGGGFTSIGGQARNHIAALDATSGAATPWDPGANAAVRALAARGSIVYAGGEFTGIGGQARNRIAALDAVTGLATAWNPDANLGVSALAVSGSTIYAGGTFSSIGGQVRNLIAALDAATGSATAWNPFANGGVSALGLSGSTVVAGGGFSSIGGQARNRLAALDTVGGSATTWDPDANGGVHTVTVDGSAVYAGGSFTGIGGLPQSYIAAIASPAGTFTITAIAGPNGAISPSGAVSVPRGQDRLFTISPNPGYHVQDVVVDGGSIGPVNQYTFTNVQADHTIAAGFAVDSVPPAPPTADAYLLASHGFDDPQGDCRPRGWTAQDLSSRLYAHVADRFLVNDAFITMGTRALWVGADEISAPDEVAQWVHPYGFGNGWSQRMTSPVFTRSAYPRAALRFDASIAFRGTPGLSSGTSGNDFLAVQGLRSDGTWALLHGRRIEFDGPVTTDQAVTGAGAFKYEVRLGFDGNETIPLAEQLQLRVVVQSDASGSSEDGLVPLVPGAAVIDNVTLSDSLVDIIAPVDFEGGGSGPWMLSAANGAFDPALPPIIRDLPSPQALPQLRAGFDPADPSCAWTFTSAGDSVPSGVYARISSPWIALADPDSQVLIAFAGKLNTVDPSRVVNVIVRGKDAGDLRPRHASRHLSLLTSGTGGDDAASPFFAERVLAYPQGFLGPRSDDSIQVVFQVEDRGEAGAGLFGRPPTRLPYLDDIRIYQVITDSDGDGVANIVDACPTVSAAGQDADGDGCVDSTATLRHVESWSRGSYPIPFTITQEGDPAIADGSDLAAVRAGFDAWQLVTGAEVPVVEDASTSQTEAAALDGVNLVTFTDADLAFPPSVLAVTPTTSFIRRAAFDDRVVRPGEIVDADLLFNPVSSFSTPTRPGAHDLRSVATHEIGHFLGLSHSGVLDATMFFVLQPGTGAATLTADDASAVAAAYPDANLATSFATILGAVRRGRDGLPLPGALVTAVRLDGGGAPVDSTASDYSDEEGRYALRRLAPGDYSVRITPLDGDVGGFPLTPAYVSARLSAIAETDFQAEWWSDPESDRDDPGLRGVIPLVAGEMRGGIDVITSVDTLPPAVAAVLPGVDATDVAIDAPILVRFSEPVLPASLEKAFRLQRADLTSSIAGGGQLIDGREFVFKPREVLEFGHRYRIVISPELTDREGLPLAGEFVSAFTTQGRPTFAVTGIHPDAAPVGSIVTLTGVGFDPTPGAVNKVLFSVAGGAPDSLDGSNVTPSSMVVTVPGDAVTGPVVVVAAGPETSTPVDFTVLPPGPVVAPVVGISPATLGFAPTDVALSPDGRTAFVVGDGGFASVDLSSASRPITVHSTAHARSIALTPDGMRAVFSRPGRGEVVVADAARGSGTFGQALDTLAVSGIPGGVAVSPDGKRAYVTDGLEGAVHVLDIDPGSIAPYTERHRIRLAATALTGGVAVDPRGATLFLSSSDRGLLAVDLASDAEVVLNPTPSAGGIAVPPNGAEVLAVGGTLVSSLVTAELSDVIGIGSQILLGGAPRDVTVHPQGRTALVVNSLFHEVQVVDLDPASPTYHRAVARVPTGRSPVAIAVSAAGDVIAVANYGDRSLSIYPTGGADASLRRIVPDLALPGDMVGVETDNGAYGGGALVDLGDGRFPATHTPGQGVGFVVPLAPSHQRATSLTLEDPLGNRSLSLPFHLVDRIESHAPKLPPFASGAAPPDCAQGPGAGASNAALRLSTDGRVLATARCYDTCPSIVRFYQASAAGSEVLGGFLRQAALGEGEDIRDLVFSPDSRRLYVAMGGSDLRVLDADPASPTFGQELPPPAVPFTLSPTCLATDPLGRFLLVGGGSGPPMVMWLTPQGGLVDTVHTPTTPTSLAATGDGRYLLVGMNEQALVIDLSTRTVVATTPLHAGAGTVVSVAVVGNGRRAAGLFPNSTLAVWNLDPLAGPVGGELYFGNPFPSGTISQLLPAPDGDGLLAGCSECDQLSKVEASVVPPTVQTSSLGQTSTRLARSGDGRRLWVVETDTTASMGGLRMFSLSEASAMDLVTGAGQSARPGETLPLPIQVRLRDASGRPQVGVVVTFRLQGADPGTLDGLPGASVRRLTDINGQAFTRWTLGTTPGPSALEVVALGVQDTLTTSATAVGSDAEIVPQVVLLGPPDGATELNAGTALFARFNQRMSKASVSAHLSVRLASGPAPGTFRFEEDGRMTVFQPQRALPFNAPCTLLVAAGALDLDGQATLTDAVSVFTTEAPPTVLLKATSPPAAASGGTVVLEGEGFSPIASQNVVLFNGRLAPVSRATTTSLVTSVPTDATAGPVKVILGASTSNELHFEVLAPTPTPGESLATVPAGKPVSDVAITPDGRRAYVTSPATNSVGVLDIEATAFLETITVGLQPQGIAMLPDGRRAYVANTGSDDLSVIDTDPSSPTYHTVVDRVPVGDGPVDLVTSAVGPTVYVANSGSGTVSIIDANTNNGTYHQVVTTVNAGSGASSIAITPDATRIYVGVAAGVVMVDLASQVVTTVNAGSGSSSITITPDGTLVLALLDDGRVIVIDATPGSATFNQVVTTVNAGSGASSITVSPDATLAYVTSADGNVVLVYQIVKLSSGASVTTLPGAAVTLTLVAVIPVGGGPADIAVDPSHNLFALVVNQGSGSITIIGIPTSLPPVPIEFVFSPGALNLGASGRWVTCYLEPPPPFLPADIDPASVRLHGLIAPDPTAPRSIGDHDEDGLPDLMLKFDRAAVQLILPAGDRVPVRVEGAIGSRTFEGTDSIRVQAGKVTHPQRDEIVNPLVPYTVRWEIPRDLHVSRVALLHSLDRGATWTLDTALLPNKGFAEWIPPNVLADSVLVAVVELSTSSGDTLVTTVVGVSEFFRVATPTAAEVVPARLEFASIRPNPSVGTVRLRFGLPQPGRVDLELYDVQGRRLATLVAWDLEAGWHEVTWDGRSDAGGSAGAGLYFVRLRAGGQVFRQRMIWIR